MRDSRSGHGDPVRATPIAQDARVCPDCGEPAGSQPFCAHCGLNLSGQQRLPARREWEAEHHTQRDGEATPSAAPDAPPVATSTAPASGGPESRDDAAVGVETPVRDGDTPPSGLPRVELPPPQAAYARQEAASWGYRLGGALIDLGFAALLGILAGVVAHAAGAGDTKANQIGVAGAALGWLITTVAVVQLTPGQSIGKAIGGMRIYRFNGEPANWWIGFLRNTLCLLLYFIPFFALVDIFLPLGSAHLSLRDRIVGTTVLREPAYKSRAAPLTTLAVLLVAAAAGGSIALGVWDEATDYTSADRDAFVSTCAESGGAASEARCGCAFDYIKARLPYDEYRSADATPDGRDLPPQVARLIRRAFREC